MTHIESLTIEPPLPITVGSAQMFIGTSAKPSTQFNMMSDQQEVVFNIDLTSSAWTSLGQTITLALADPLIPETDIPLYRIAALLDGNSTLEQVKEDFPSLTADQIVFARDYARQYPNFGRPYPKTSLKRMLRNSGFHQIKKELADIRRAKRARGVSAR